MTLVDERDHIALRSEVSALMKERAGLVALLAEIEVSVQANAVENVGLKRDLAALRAQLDAARGLLQRFDGMRYSDDRINAQQLAADLAAFLSSPGLVGPGVAVAPCGALDPWSINGRRHRGRVIVIVEDDGRYAWSEAGGAERMSAEEFHDIAALVEDSISNPSEAAK